MRPLFDDGASAKEATRDYALKASNGGDAPLINVFGGKLTTYRRLSQSVVDMIGDAIGAKGPRWTAKGALPGGDFPATGFEALAEQLQRSYAALDAHLVRRLARNYGTRARMVLGDARSTTDLGEDLARACMPGGRLSTPTNGQ